jgi:hypothetical protein
MQAHRPHGGIVNINYNRLALYVANTVLVLLIAALIKPGQSFLSVYWPLAFWTLVVLDIAKCNREGWENDARSPFADRFCGYIFAAPFILLARGAELIPVRARS